MAKSNTNTNTTPDPRGVEEIPGQDRQDSAAGAVLSPPEAVDGGRAEKMDADDLAVRMAAVGEAASAFVDSVSRMGAEAERVLGPVVQAAREVVSRAAGYAAVAESLVADDGGQESSDSRAETSDGVDAGGQEPIVVHVGDVVQVEPTPGDAVETGAEITADAVVRNEAGEVVDR